MTNDKFFAGWQSPSYYPSEVNIEYEEKAAYLKSDEHLEFELNPKEYFKCKGKDCVALIPEFLNEELIQKDPFSYIYGYNQILKQVCFSEDKEIPLNTLSEIVISSNGTRESVTRFLFQTGLAEKTERMFKILNMESEWKTLRQILEYEPMS